MTVILMRAARAVHGVIKTDRLDSAWHALDDGPGRAGPGRAASGSEPGRAGLDWIIEQVFQTIMTALAVWAHNVNTRYLLFYHMTYDITYIHHISITSTYSMSREYHQSLKQAAHVKWNWNETETKFQTEVDQIVLFQFHFSSTHMWNNTETNSKVGAACQAEAGLAVDLIVGLAATRLPAWAGAQ